MPVIPNDKDIYVAIRQDDGEWALTFTGLTGQMDVGRVLIAFNSREDAEQVFRLLAGQFNDSPAPDPADKEPT